MSLVHLEELVDSFQWEESARLAQELLSNGTAISSESALLHSLACRARIGLGDFLGAVTLGEVALELAYENRQWDTLARALYDLSNAYYFVRRYQDQLDLHFKYLDYRKHYSEKGLRFEGWIWWLMGLAYLNGLNDLQKAKSALKLAREWFHRRSETGLLERVRRDLIQTCLLMGELDDAKVLLDEGEAFAQSRPDDQLAQFDQQFDTCRYLRVARRNAESVKVGLKALETAKGHPVWEFLVYMELHRNALETEDYTYALGFALSARLSALDAKRYDAEYEATAAMIELIRARGPDLLLEAERQYRQYGLDIFQYVPESLLRRGKNGAN
jgi:hypothetical protein